MLIGYLLVFHGFGLWDRAALSSLALRASCHVSHMQIAARLRAEYVIVSCFRVIKECFHSVSKMVPERHVTQKLIIHTNNVYSDVIVFFSNKICDCLILFVLWPFMKMKQRSYFRKSQQNRKKTQIIMQNWAEH